MKVIDLEYEVELLVNKHIFRVICKISKSHSEKQLISMPRWLPGSYLIRHFAKNIIAIKVLTEGAICEQVDTATWEISGAVDHIVLQYDIYGLDASVRGLYLDNQRCFINLSRICFQVEAKENSVHRIHIKQPKDFPTWKIATTLTVEKINSNGFGYYYANNYDELIDHPLEIGDFECFSFYAATVKHDIVISGRFEGDLKRLAADLAKICEYQINFFGMPAPFLNYLFILNLVGEGYGGLEHRSSTALQATRDALPVLGATKLTKEYLALLGLFSHEYFHAWNVKRIKPACFMPYDLSKETPTPLLWVFEGFTTYYDDLLLVRSGVISEAEYFKILSEMISRYYRTPGRFKQTLVGSSIEAWTKFYQPDENSPNAQISYYLKGALAALCLDLNIRKLTHHEKSLDDIMHWLWQEKGLKNKGVEQFEIEQKIIEIGGQSIAPILNKILYTTEPLPLEACLDDLDLKLTLKSTPNLQRLEWNETDNLITSCLGVSLIDKMGRLYCQYVLSDSAAERAGLTANDELVAINDIKIVPGAFEKIMKYMIPNNKINIHIFRRDELILLSVILDAVSEQTVILSRNVEKNNQFENLRCWLSA